MKYVFINDQFLDEDKALISIKDRGFKYGDGVFETISVYESTPYQWELHIARLKESLSTMKIQDCTEYIYENVMELIKKNGAKSSILRITITRGEGIAGYLPPKSIKSNIIIETYEKHPVSNKPVDIWLSNIKKIPKSSLPSHIKTLQGLNSVLAKTEAEENNCFESLLMSYENQICECSSGNIFWFKNQVLYTPSLESGILRGTTRDAVIRLSPFEVKEGIYTIDDLTDADEVFITNVNWQVLPVKSILPLKKIWKYFKNTEKLQKLFKEDIADYVIAKNSALD